MPDPAFQAGMRAGDAVIDTLLSFFPNLLNQMNRIGGAGGPIPVYDTQLGYDDVFRNAGYGDLTSTVLGIGTGFVEPGPAEFRALGDLAPLLAGIPRFNLLRRLPDETIDAIDAATEAGTLARPARNLDEMGVALRDPDFGGPMRAEPGRGFGVRQRFFRGENAAGEGPYIDIEGFRKQTFANGGIYTTDNPNYVAGFFDAYGNRQQDATGLEFYLTPRPDALLDVTAPQNYGGPNPDVMARVEQAALNLHPEADFAHERGRIAAIFDGYRNGDLTANDLVRELRGFEQLGGHGLGHLMNAAGVDVLMQHIDDSWNTSNPVMEGVVFNRDVMQPYQVDTGRSFAEADFEMQMGTYERQIEGAFPKRERPDLQDLSRTLERRLDAVLPLIGNNIGENAEIWQEVSRLFSERGMDLENRARFARVLQDADDPMRSLALAQQFSPGYAWQTAQDLGGRFPTIREFNELYDTTLDLPVSFGKDAIVAGLIQRMLGEEAFRLPDLPPSTGAHFQWGFGGPPNNVGIDSRAREDFVNMLHDEGEQATYNFLAERAPHVPSENVERFLQELRTEHNLSDFSGTHTPSVTTINLPNARLSDLRRHVQGEHYGRAIEVLMEENPGLSREDAEAWAHRIKEDQLDHDTLMRASPEFTPHQALTVREILEIEDTGRAYQYVRDHAPHVRPEEIMQYLREQSAHLDHSLLGDLLTRDQQSDVLAYVRADQRPAALLKLKEWFPNHTSEDHQALLNILSNLLGGAGSGGGR